MFVMTEFPDTFLYEAGFKNRSRALTVCDIVSPTDSIIVRCDRGLAKLLRNFHEPDCEEWMLLDAIGVHRPGAPQEMRRFVRRNILIFASGSNRRFAAYGESPWTHHKMYCQRCSPTVESRTAAKNELIDARECNLSLWARNYRSNFYDMSTLGSEPAQETLEQRERMQKFASLASERGHATARTTLKGGAAHTTLDTFGRVCMLKDIVEEHGRACGDGSYWKPVSAMSLRDKSKYEALPGGDGEDEPVLLPLPMPSLPAIQDAEARAEVVAPLALARQTPHPESGRGANPSTVAQLAHLNPLLLAYNRGLAVAKQLKGKTLTIAEIGVVRQRPPLPISDPPLAAGPGGPGGPTVITSPSPTPPASTSRPLPETHLPNIIHRIGYMIKINQNRSRTIKTNQDQSRSNRINEDQSRSAKIHQVAPVQSRSIEINQNRLRSAKINHDPSGSVKINQDHPRSTAIAQDQSRSKIS